MPSELHWHTPEGKTKRWKAESYAPMLFSDECVGHVFVSHL